MGRTGHPADENGRRIKALAVHCSAEGKRRVDRINDLRAWAARRRFKSSNRGLSAVRTAVPQVARPSRAQVMRSNDPPRPGGSTAVAVRYATNRLPWKVPPLAALDASSSQRPRLRQQATAPVTKLMAHTWNGHTDHGSRLVAAYGEIRDLGQRSSSAAGSRRRSSPCSGGEAASITGVQVWSLVQGAWQSPQMWR
jgi:hypothetical protein